MTQHVFTVPNISCGHCVAAITNELKELDGVQQVNGDPQTENHHRRCAAAGRC